MRVFTQAPSVYDYGYTTEVDPEVKIESNGYTFFGRIVEIPDEAADYQMARYESGSYITTEVK